MLNQNKRMFKSTPGPLTFTQFNVVMIVLIIVMLSAVVAAVVIFSSRSSGT